MLIGQYIHTLDPKKRLSLPAKFRKELGKTVVVTHGWDMCLSVYSAKEWKKTVETFTNLSVGQSDTRKLTRFIVGNASEVDIDAAGRILIPDTLKDMASFSEKVVVVGLQDHVELWDETTWKSYQDTARERADAIAEKLGESGEL